ncbi:uncharacterized protein LOC131936029 [Physella acuta]|uniref:uncharacterized protein LOC131936029 n=1 Tax=Physella acuta TaxID=109671 RepID=UPI0027DE52BE|nr:uncharacterized protein LOC131936029 [Physella acuta]
MARTEFVLSLVFVIRSIAGETCISNCEGKAEGNYVLCGPKCKAGNFMTCTGEKGIEMPCAMGEYIQDNSTKYLARLIFDPSMGACMYSNKICSTPEFKVTSCLTYGCSYRMDGEYPLCGRQCFEGYYAECHNGVMSKKSCSPETDDANSSALVFQPSTKKCEMSTDVCKKDMEIIKEKLKDKRKYIYYTSEA